MEQVWTFFIITFQVESYTGQIIIVFLLLSGFPHFLFFQDRAR